MFKMIVAADLIVQYPDGKIILIKRKNDPYKDYWALPGGMVEEDETVEEAAVREAEEETGVKIELKKLVGVYSDPDRDPRGRVMSVTYLAEPLSGEPKAADDAAELMLTKDYSDIRLAFDHNRMLYDAFGK
ncbi:MAG: NUDIX domain-containing protein [candidate division Zixibacteria bacterium]|nr:NUDIX domain-containing protein [candidate division Zixibacteria bacterium]